MSASVPIISVLIPIFNFEVEALIERLVTEARNFPSEIEIICADDYSHSAIREANRDICKKHLVKYIELEKNYGRSKIRNFLAQQSHGKYLLFIDCDSAIPKEGFLARYLQYGLNNQVIYGGRIYDSKMPADPQKRFHWKYGHQVEAPSFEKRKKMGHMAFQSNNFLAPKTLFTNLSFDEDIQGYGYEDLMLAQILVKNGFQIIHLDNPVVHIGLESQLDFLKKTENAIINLSKLHKSNKAIETRLTKFLDHVDNLGLMLPVNWFTPVFEKLFRTLLKLNDPPIWIFQGWKFCMYCNLLQEGEKKRTDR